MGAGRLLFLLKKYFNFYLKNSVRSIDIPKYFLYKKYEYKKISMHFFIKVKFVQNS